MSDNIIYVRFGKQPEPTLDPEPLQVDKNGVPVLTNDFEQKFWQKMSGSLYFADLMGSHIIVTDFLDVIKKRWDEQIGPCINEACDQRTFFMLETNYGADDAPHATFVPQTCLTDDPLERPASANSNRPDELPEVSCGGLLALLGIPAVKSDIVFTPEEIVDSLWAKLSGYINSGYKTGYDKTAYYTLANIYDGDFRLSVGGVYVD